MTKGSIRGVVIDTGFWLEAFDTSQSRHTAAAAALERLTHSVVLLPWPIVYEVIRTRTARSRTMMSAFERVIRRPKVLRVDDQKYRMDCLEAAFDTARHGRPLSLVDLVVRAVLSDRTYRISRLLTYNPGDFHDICLKRHIAIEPAAVTGR